MTPDQQSRVTRHEFVSGLRRVLRPRTLPRDRRRRGLRAGAFQCKDDRHRPGLSDHPEVKTALQPERPSILVASRLTTTGVAATLSQTRALLVRHWWPLALVAASSRGDCGGRRSRRRSSPRWASTCGPDPTSTRSGSRSPAASTTSRTAQASGGAPSRDVLWERSSRPSPACVDSPSARKPHRRRNERVPRGLSADPLEL